MPLNLIHRIRLPKTSSPSPAIVMVHGWLGDENAMWAFDRVLPLDAVAVTPRGPFEAGEGFGWTAVRGGGDTFDQGLDALREFVARLPEVYPVDPSRIVLLGFSQGAAMSYALTLASPTVAAATAALAGFLPDSARQWIIPGRLDGKPIFIAHGLDDTTVPIEEAVRAREALTLAGANVSYHEYAIGHKLSAQGMRDLKAWLEKSLS
ncbi:MAG: alpha/beta fold hydrolase [Chloroflexota bacterium]